MYINIETYSFPNHSWKWLVDPEWSGSWTGAIEGTVAKDEISELDQADMNPWLWNFLFLILSVIHSLYIKIWTFYALPREDCSKK